MTLTATDHITKAQAILANATPGIDKYAVAEATAHASIATAILLNRLLTMPGVTRG